MRARHNSILIGLLALGASSCQWIVGPRDAACDPDASIDELTANQAQFEIDGCMPFWCTADGELKRRVSGERYDGQDNDCDGRVDEGVWKDAATHELQAPGSDYEGLRVTWSATWRNGVNRQLRVFLSSAMGEGNVFDLSSTEVPPGLTRPLPLRVQEVGDPLFPDGRGECPICLNRALWVGDCRLGDLVGMQWPGEGWLLGGRDDVSGERSPVRVGLASATSDRFVQPVTSPLAAGVGVTCGRGPDRGVVRDASRISVATSNAMASNATSDAGLVAWVTSRVREQPTCDSRETPTVQVLPVRAPRGVLTATLDVPRTLGDTTARSGRPAIVPLRGSGDDSHFLVGFGRNDGVSLCLLRDGQGSCERLIEDQDVEQVVMAIGARDEVPAAVGVAWTTACGSGVRFARVVVDAGMTLRQEPDVVVRLAAGEGLSSPSIVWSDAPFRVANDRRPAMDPCVGGAPADELGGWIVSWASALGGEHRVRAVRVDADGVHRRDARGAACEPATDVHRLDEAVQYHALHRMMQGGRASVVALTATRSAIWFRELYGRFTGGSQ